jgi:small GTP-binding protein
MELEKFKLIVVGESNVGKTCIIMRYTEDSFTNNFEPTVGVDFKVVDRAIDGRRVRLQLWDTAGQEKFHTITQSYFRGAHGALVVFDVTSATSRDRTHMWMDSIRETACEDIQIVLVGNKSDCDDRKVSSEDGLALGREFGVPYFETSAKTGQNIDLVFASLGRDVIRRAQARPGSRQRQIAISDPSPPARNCC